MANSALLGLMLVLSCFATPRTVTGSGVCPDSMQCIGAPGVDENGCCDPLDTPDCCDRGPLGKFCHLYVSDSRCCQQDETPCQEITQECYKNTDLCGGQCCSHNSGPGLCCGNTTCCQYPSSTTCRRSACGQMCTKTVNGVPKTTFCKEPNICCQGNCVDPVRGNKKLPCKGRCCNVDKFDRFPETDYNGVCCKDECCSGSETCCKDKSGTFCGIPCGRKTCCRDGTHCCDGKCVDDNAWCDGNCCTGKKAGSCCGNQCCPKPAVCCNPDFPGNFFFGQCCKSCDCPEASDGCCPL